MSYIDEHYRTTKNGDFASEEEAKLAADNKHIIKTSNGYYDPETGIEYWEDGTKK